MLRFVSSLLVLLCAGPLHSAEWDRYRGPNGSGVETAWRFPTQWEAADIAWKTNLPGEGHGSPVIWGGRVFLLAADPKTSERMPLCVDLESGKILWQGHEATGKFKGHRFNGPATSTPAVADDAVYFAWGTAEQLTLAAYDHDGQSLWKQDLGPVVGGHGFGASPMVLGDLLVLNNDQEKQNGFLIALNRHTGETVWKVARKSQRISYSVPVVYPHPATGEPLLVFTNWTHGFTVINPKDGAVVAELSVFSQEQNERAISSPIVWRDLVIGTCGFTNNPKHCVAVRLKADNTLEEVWRIERSVPHIPSVIAVGDHVFLWDDSGIVTCVDPATGKDLWRERVETDGQVFGSPVSDGSSLFLADQSGTVHVIRADGTFGVLARNPLDETCRTTPAMGGGKLLVRTLSHLTAVRAR
ncbi:MAG: PQQ-binding-like beta-propeller repeat protein [Verrucomicrobiales bacterium]|nr:PQQ-binding-like beta-propeller repeat protein [Verrucomicrobiales bacterium]